MAVLKGKGAATDVNLIAVGYTNAASETSRWLDVQIDHRDPRAKDQSNLHLSSSKETRDGAERYIHTVPYSESKQIPKMVEAAGDNKAPKYDIDGNVTGQIIAFKGSLMTSDDNKGWIVNTSKPMGPSEFGIDDKTLDAQYASMQDASEKNKAAKAQEQEAAPQAEQPQAPQGSGWGAPSQQAPAQASSWGAPAQDQEPSLG